MSEPTKPMSIEEQINKAIELGKDFANSRISGQEFRKKWNIHGSCGDQPFVFMHILDALLSAKSTIDASQPRSRPELEKALWEAMPAGCIYGHNDAHRNDNRNKIVSSILPLIPAATISQDAVELAKLILDTDDRRPMQTVFEFLRSKDAYAMASRILSAPAVARQAPESVNQELLEIVKEYVERDKGNVAHLRDCQCFVCRMESVIARAQSAVASEDTRDKTIEELRLAIGELTERHQNMTTTAEALRQELAATKADAEKTIAELREKLAKLHGMSTTEVCVEIPSVGEYIKQLENRFNSKCLELESCEFKLATAEATIAETDKILSRLVVPINGYDQRVMLEDTKKLLIKHAGYQNAYTVSNIIETIRLAVVRLGAVSSFAARAAQAPAYEPGPGADSSPVRLNGPATSGSMASVPPGPRCEADDNNSHKCDRPKGHDGYHCANVSQLYVYHWPADSEQSRQAASGVPDNDGVTQKQPHPLGVYGVDWVAFQASGLSLVSIPCGEKRFGYCYGSGWKVYPIAAHNIAWFRSEAGKDSDWIELPEPEALAFLADHPIPPDLLKLATIPTITGSADAMKTPGPTPFVPDLTSLAATVAELVTKVAALEKGGVA